MELTLKRIAKKDKYTIGRLYVDGEYICDTIEDKDRGLTQSMSKEEIAKIKVQDQTAIPYGFYEITTKIRSPKFSQKDYYKAYCDGFLPRLLNVKGFDGILIHRGTDQNSSSGCIIVGYNTVVGKVTNSQKAFEKLYHMLISTSSKIMIRIQ